MNANLNVLNLQCSATTIILLLFLVMPGGRDVVVLGKQCRIPNCLCDSTTESANTITIVFECNKDARLMLNSNQLESELIKLNGTEYRICMKQQSDDVPTMDTSSSSNLFGTLNTSSLFCNPRHLNIVYVEMTSSRFPPVIGDSVFGACDNNIREMLLRSNGISDTFLIASPNLTTLDIQDNNLRRLDRKLLARLVRLQYLLMDRNMLEFIEAGAFQNLTALAELSIPHNQLFNLSGGLLSSLVNLTKLDLSDNSLTETRRDYFVGLVSLVELKLSFNPLRYIEEHSFSQLTRLAILELENSFIRLFEPNMFTGLVSLNIIRIDQCISFRIQNDTFSQLVGLKKLYFYNNNVRVIEPLAFRNLTNLTTLELSGNRLTQLTANTLSSSRSLSNLQDLILSSNSIESIEANSLLNSQPNSLRRINLGLNRLLYVKKFYFCNLRQLEDLVLTDNQISHIETGSFDGLIALSILHLNRNCLFSIKPEMFKSLVSLRQLYLYDNKISRIANNSLPVLIDFDLSNNLITSSEFSLFTVKYVSKTVSLNLHNNRLTELSSTMFDNPIVESRLYKLNLEHNDIISLSQIRFERFTSLTLLNLSFNQNLKDNQISYNSSQLSESLSHLKKLKLLSLRYVSTELMRAINFFILPPTCMFELTLTSEIDIDFVMRNIPVERIKTIGMLAPWLSEKQKLPFLMRAVSLVTLDLSHSCGKIDFTDGFMKKLTQMNLLYELIISDACLSSLEPFDFSIFNFLFVIDLSFNNLTSIQKENDFGLAVCLNFSNNQIETIHPDFLNADVVRLWIDLSYNRLKIFYLSNELLLRSIYLQGNQLNGVGGLVFGTLHGLDLSDNNFTQFPFDPTLPSFTRLSDTLESLNMSKNKISRVKRSCFNQLTGLINLDLSFNRIEIIEDYSFMRQPRMTDLDLTENLLSSNLTDFTFYGLIQLKSLNISHNSLETVHKNLFSALINLKSLNLAHNRLRFVADSAFSSNIFLKELQLGFNTNLTHLTTRTLQGLDSIKTIYVPRELIATNNGSNLLIFKASLPRRPTGREVQSVVYLNPVDIIYSPYSQERTEDDCHFTLYMIRLNIKLNLFKDDQYTHFESVCRIHKN